MNKQSLSEGKGFLAFAFLCNQKFLFCHIENEVAASYTRFILQSSSLNIYCENRPCLIPSPHDY